MASFDKINTALHNRFLTGFSVLLFVFITINCLFQVTMRDRNKKPYKDGLDSKARARYDEKLLTIGGDDPYEIDNNECSTNQNSFPPVDYIDIVNYLVNSKSAYTFEELRAYKSLESYNQMCCGWVHDVKSKDYGNYILVIGKVRHSQRMNEAPLRPWLILSKTGYVESAHCNCMAGLGETCSHVGAVLFYLDACHRINSNKTVTQEKAYWALPTGVKSVPYSEIKDIDFTSAATKKRKLECVINGEEPDTRISTKLPNVPEPTSLEKDVLLRNLFQSKSNASVLTVSSLYQKNYLPKILQEGQLTTPLIDLHDEKYINMTADELKQECVAIFNSISITEQQAMNVEIITRDQSKCRDWHRLRMGRITASIMKSVCVTSLENPSLTTVNTICGRNKFKNKATEYGCAHEKDALQSYKKIMQTEHENFSLTPCGLFIDPKHPFIGATPDALVNCNCCGQGVVEIKCPLCAKDTTLEEANIKYLTEKKLKENHSYFYQVQTQMLVTGRDYCDFVVWCKKEVNIERIEVNTEKGEEIVQKSKDFFIQVILPELTGSLISRQKMTKEPAVQVKPVDQTTDQRIELPPTPAANCFTALPIENKKLKHKDMNPLKQHESTKMVSSLQMCLCGEVCSIKERSVLCDNENCKFGNLHFSCVGLKRKPKPPYYCPECRKNMW